MKSESSRELRPAGSQSDQQKENSPLEWLPGPVRTREKQQ